VGARRMSASASRARADDSRLLWRDGERAFSRERRVDPAGVARNVLVLRLTAEHPARASLDRLAHEYGLKDELEGAWAVRPLALVQEEGRTLLVLEDPGGEPLDTRPGQPLDVIAFLRLAIRITGALRRAHRGGLIHKDLKPAHILVNGATGQVRLTGLGIASRLPRERQPPTPPEFIAGSLPYMAPEQTGRMNRSVDSRSDLYALGVTFYEMLTGGLPFAASDPMGWVHGHVARQPARPSERRAEVPGPLSDIVLKLLGKTGEERYQTARGVEHDLRRCLRDRTKRGRIDPFALGENDQPDRLLVPEKLYGRSSEVRVLLDAFERAVHGGPPELVLVSGYSGIGKSSVVGELQKALVPPRALFASGKFDQYKRDIPYATLAQAFQGLVRTLLAKSDAELVPWRDALREALGPNGRLITDLVPELALIVGEQPPIPELPSQDARGRFQLVFGRFIGVFARAEHPLALFLDDLQWLDAATLELLEHLLTAAADLDHLLLIGAYRDNEVTATHPLMRMRDAIRSHGAPLDQMVLAPLAPEDLRSLVADSLYCDPEAAGPLVDLVLEKTAGNPFFVIQFLSVLAEEGLLVFEHRTARWTWDLSRIHAKGYTDNVVDLMIGKVGRLPGQAREVLQTLACLGPSAPAAVLAIVREGDEEALRGDLDEALVVGLVLRSGGTYRFLHDRVQEAAYASIPEPERAAAHLRIGRLLVAHASPQQREDQVFEIVNQLNRGAGLITANAEKEQLAELNLLAGRRAKASTAYASALRYLDAGVALVAVDRRDQRPDLTFALELHAAECRFLTGEIAVAEAALTRLATRAARSLDRATVACLRIDLYMTLDRNDRAIDVCLDYLRHLGFEWTSHPAEEQARREYDRIWSRVGSRDIETLTRLPLMREPDSVATMDVLTKALTPALYTDANLVCLLVCRMIDLTLANGNTDGSCLAYAWLGRIAGLRFENYPGGSRFGRLGRDLVEQAGLERFKARAYMNFASYSMPWTRHVREGQDVLRRAYDVATANGDITHAAFSGNNLLTNLLAAGDPLADLQREAERALGFVRKTGFNAVIQIIGTQLGLVRMLRGLTARFGCLDDGDFDESRIERAFSDIAEGAGAPIAAFRYWTRKLQARFFAGDYGAAIAASLKAQDLFWTLPSTPDSADAHFYGALSHAASCHAADPAQQRTHLDAMARHCRQLRLWAEHCPENFENRAALVEAEIARLEGRERDAMRLYETAIHSARDNAFVHNEAVACEVASRFYEARGFDEIAHLYLRNARNAYLRWGADGKVRQLEESHPWLARDVPRAAGTSTIGAAVETLDLATVVDVSRAVSSEIVLDRLLETLLRTAIQQAGAQRGVLVVVGGSEPCVEAEAVVDGDAVHVRLLDEPLTDATLPQAVLRYVLRTQEPLILDDIAAEQPFSVDPYVRRTRAHSVFCLPLLAHARLAGVLYLENKLAARVFVPGRTAVLKLVASQAAIALENARLYRDLAEREARIRRMVDANIVGTFTWKRMEQGAEGGPRLVEANDAFLGMVGYDRDDLAAGRLTRGLVSPPESRERDAQAMAQLQAGGTVPPFEKEYVRRDGSRVPVLVGFAAFDATRSEGIAFAIDLTEQKRAEAEARESERRFRDSELALAHASRIATMGQLTASIAHEVSQPVSGALTNANTALRLLRRPTPRMAEAIEALELIVRDGNRARAVVDRIRALVRKAPAQRHRIEVNETVREVVALVEGQAGKGRIQVHLALAAGLPCVEGDRVQLQQVLLNLIVNAIEALSDVEERSRELSIATEHVGLDEVMVEVSDSGPGIDPERLPHVFEPFYSTKPAGLGMGLSICRSIVEAHGGRIVATSRVPRGTVFRFTLPAMGAPASDAAKSARSP
jgi:PAS domain S-box-containing protein